MINKKKDERKNIKWKFIFSYLLFIDELGRINKPADAFVISLIVSKQQFKQIDFIFCAREWRRPTRIQ